MEKKTSEIEPTDWRFIAMVYGNINFQDKFFNHKDSAIRIIEVHPDEKPRDDSVHVIEVYSKSSSVPKIETAYYRSIELLNEFLDQLSFISFQPSYVVSPIAISHAMTKIGQTFPMLHSHSSVLRKRVLITTKDLMDFSDLTDLEKDAFNLLRILNYYQQARRLDEKFLHLYSVLDRIASIESEEYQIKKCDNCGREVTLDHKATSNYIRKLAKDHDVASFNFNKIRGFRAKIAHGVKKRDYEFFDELSEHLPALETLAYRSILNRLPINMKLTTNQHSYTPFLTITGKCDAITNEIMNLHPEAKGQPCVFYVQDYHLGLNVQYTNIGKASDHDERSQKLTNGMDDREFFDGSTGIIFDGEFGELQIYKYAWPYFSE